MVNADARSSCHRYLACSCLAHHELQELKTLHDYWAFLLYFDDIFCSILSLQLGLSSSYVTVGMSCCYSKQWLFWPWELHEEVKTEDVLEWSKECPKGNSCIHFLRVMLREARPYMMMRACCLLLPRRPHSGSAANRSPVSWPVWPILSRERSQNPECKKNILTAILKPCNKLPLKYSEKLVYAMQRTYMQGLAKRQFPGLVTFGSAVAYHFCLALPQHSRNLGTIL